MTRARSLALGLCLAGCASHRPLEDPIDAAGEAPTQQVLEAGPIGIPTEVFGQTPTALYRLDPTTKDISKVGDFDGCIYVNDIALDQRSTIYGVTANQLVTIDRNTARCSLIATGAFPNSLSFVPAGTLDPQSEALVGYEGADYVRIDTQTGAKKKVGALGGGFTSSGDVVSAIGGKTYLTAKGPSCNDCLLEIDPKTGALVTNLGPLGYADVFGVAFWAGRVYGFANDGTLFEVTIANGSATSAEIMFPNKPPNLKWAGAGSTTSAPIVPPK